METLTIYDALIGELDPYTPNTLTLRKSIYDSGLKELMEQEYDPEVHKVAVAKAAIMILKKMIVLTSDSLGKSSQGYSVEMLEQRIKDLCNENGLDVSEYVEVPSITDGSNLW